MESINLHMRDAYDDQNKHECRAWKRFAMWFVQTRFAVPGFKAKRVRLSKQEIAKRLAMLKKKRKSA